MKPISVPDSLGLKRINSVEELYRLKDRKKVWTKLNVCLNVGQKYQIFSPYSGKLYQSEITEYTNVDLLREYIGHGNVYDL